MYLTRREPFFSLESYTDNSSNHWTLWNFSSYSRETIWSDRRAMGGPVCRLDGTLINAAVTAAVTGCRPVCGDWRCGVFVFLRGGRRGQAVLQGKKADRITWLLSCAWRRPETRYYRICWNDRGQLTSVYDKKNEREVHRGRREETAWRIFEDKPMQFLTPGISTSLHGKVETTGAYRSAGALK